MRIGELAQSCGCAIETIRYYEKVGLLPKPDRQSNGYRVYQESHRKWLLFILRTRELGFSQDDVRRLTNLAHEKRPPCSEVHEMLQEQVGAVQKRIRELAQLEQALVRLKSQCHDGTLHECPVIDELME